MKRIAILILGAALLACGSDSSGPTDTFSGTWVGDAFVDASDTLHVVLTPTQNGSSISGTGTLTAGSAGQAITYNGVSTPPTINLTIVAGMAALNYSGTYVRSDSVVGLLSGNGDTVALSLKKQ